VITSIVTKVTDIWWYVR